MKYAEIKTLMTRHCSDYNVINNLTVRGIHNYYTYYLSSDASGSFYIGWYNWTGSGASMRAANSEVNERRLGPTLALTTHNGIVSVAAEVKENCFVGILHSVQHFK